MWGDVEYVSTLEQKLRALSIEARANSGHGGNAGGLIANLGSISAIAAFPPS